MCWLTAVVRKSRLLLTAFRQRGSRERLIVRAEQMGKSTPVSKTPRSKLFRVSVRTVGAALAVCIAFALIGVPIYVFPAVDAPQRADYIYVLGPPTVQRVEMSEQLRKQGVADKILVSVPTSGAQSKEEAFICRMEYVICAHPDPATTKGEIAMAEELIDGASIVIITFRPHVARTRFVFDKCYSGDFEVVASPETLSLSSWIYQYTYQTAAFVKASLTSCATPDL